MVSVHFIVWIYCSKFCIAWTKSYVPVVLALWDTDRKIQGQPKQHSESISAFINVLKNIFIYCMCIHMHVGPSTHVEVRIQLMNDFFFLLSWPLSLSSDHLSLGNKFLYLMVHVATLRLWSINQILRPWIREMLIEQWHFYCSRWTRLNSSGNIIFLRT